MPTIIANTDKVKRKPVHSSLQLLEKTLFRQLQLASESLLFQPELNETLTSDCTRLVERSLNQLSRKMPHGFSNIAGMDDKIKPQFCDHLVTGSNFIEEGYSLVNAAENNSLVSESGDEGSLVIEEDYESFV